MKIKTSELKGHDLNWAVAKCEGGGAAYVNTRSRGKVLILADDIHPWSQGNTWMPSTDWAQGGPIIERERIRIDPRGLWCAAHDSCEWTYYLGETPLVAAMRCFVASRLGDEVEVPDELMEGVAA